MIFDIILQESCYLFIYFCTSVIDFLDKEYLTFQMNKIALSIFIRPKLYFGP